MKLFSLLTATMLYFLLNTPVYTFSQSAPANLIITEILADPDPSFGLPTAEFVEILNNDTLPISLSGWTFFDGSVRALPGITLSAGQYLIICANSDTAKFSPYGFTAGVSSLSLTNGGEKLAIRNPAGMATDSVIYSDSWFGNSFKKDGGWTLERIDVNFSCQLADNWKASVNIAGGTPGTTNSVHGFFTDQIPPQLLRAYCPDSVSVVLVFSESLQPAGIADLLNYNCSGSLQADSAWFADNTNTRVQILLSGIILKNKIYTITVNTLSDCAGNVITAGNSVKFGLYETVASGDLALNEILFNPFVDGYDFVELYNKGPRIINLQDVRIGSLNLSSGEPDKIEVITSEQWLVFPGDLVVLTEKSNAVASHYLTSYPYRFIELSKLPSMNVDEGHVFIMANGVILDDFHYFDDYHFSLIENVKGVSLEKINPFRPSSDPSSWHSASPYAGYATPGLKNSMYADQVVKNQIVFAHPEIFSPDNDGYNDQITFTVNAGEPGYIGNIYIYNVSGQVIYKNNRNNLLSVYQSFSWDGVTMSGDVAPHGIYVALVQIFNLEGDVKNYKVPFVVAVRL